MTAELETVAVSQVLGVDGQLLDGQQSSLTDDQLLEALRLMMLSRRFDERAFSLQRQGRFGTYAPTMGQEAVAIGVSLALSLDRDWLVPSYRELPALLRHGWSLRDTILYYRGHPDGWRMPERLLNVQIAVGAQLPHAAGLAWGLRYRGLDSVVAAFCGDGAASEGDFHEGLNLAGVMLAPVVFVVQNNQWAISTPASAQTAAPALSARAAGYGIAGETVDGNDLLAVHAAARAAVERARAGEGPTLIEARSYRLWDHNTADDATKYADAAERAAAEELEPLGRLRLHLTSRGLLHEQLEQELEAEIEAFIDDSFAAADAHPVPRGEEIFEHVFAEPHARLQRQRDAAVAAGRAGG